MGDGRRTPRRAEDYGLAEGLLAGIRMALPQDTDTIRGNTRTISAALEKALEDERLEPFRAHFTSIEGRTGKYIEEVPQILQAGTELELLETTQGTNPGTTNFHFKISALGARRHLRLSTTDTELPSAEQFEYLGKEVYRELQQAA